MDLHILTQCMYPLSKQFTVLVEKSQSVVLTSVQSTVSKVTDVGPSLRKCQIKFQLLQCVYDCMQAFPSCSAKVPQTKMGYFTGYYGSRVWSYNTTESLIVQCCSITVYVQNFQISGKIDPQSISVSSVCCVLFNHKVSSHLLQQSAVCEMINIQNCSVR